MTIEHKSLDLDFKADDSTDTGGFSAYFASFGNVDRGGDVIEKGAFNNLDEFKKSGWIAFNHARDDKPIAYPVDAHQDDKGLLIVGRYHDTPAAQEVRTINRERLAAGKTVQGSIGYRTLKADKSERDGKQVRSIKSLDVFECSFVNLAMNPAAQVVHSKGLISVDEARSIASEFKDGRTHSAAHIATMRRWGSDLMTLSAIGQEIIAVADQFDPPNPFKSAVPAYLETLALCVKYRPL